MQVIAVTPFLEEICQAFDRFTQERGIRIEIRNTTGTLHIRTDPKLLDLVLRNLVDNATKFAFEKTAIVVGAELMPQTSGSPGVRFSVVDRGIGIPLAHQQRIFERFYQADTARTGEGGKPSTDVNIPRGTGLGLAIVKHALKNLDGSIRVESVWKQGTTMIVEIPGCVVPDVADQFDQLDLVKSTKTY
jgi:signal transduction histidine kinase